MKTRLFQFIAAMTVVLAMVAARTASAKDSPQLADVEQALTGVAVPELPVNAATLVSQSKDSEKESVTMLVIQTISEINPASMPAVVGAIGHSTPTMASVAAANAVSLQPQQSALITRAAVGAAPDRAGEIVSAILEKMPAQYAVVASAAADTAPSAGRDILNAVITAVPSLKPYIEKNSSTATSGNVPVMTILNQSAILARRDQSAAMPVAFAMPVVTAVASASASTVSSPSSSGSASTPVVVTSSALSAASPVIGAPPVPLTAAPIEISPSQTGPQQPGGRNYSSP
jgi:hypothetical protein